MKAASRGPARRDAASDLRDIRIPFIQKAALTVRGHTEHLFLVDLGLRGAFAEREAPLPTGERVALRFSLPGKEIPINFGCRVAWWHPREAPLVSKALPAGVGLEFVQWSEEDEGRLRRYLEAYLRRSAGRRFHRPLPLGDGDEP